MKCPECGTLVPEGDLFCGNCGQRMQSAPEPTVAVAMDAPPPAVPPPTDAPPAPPPAPEPKSRSWLPWVIGAVVVLGLCLVCGGGGAAFYLLRPTPTPTWTPTPTPLPPPTATATPRPTSTPLPVPTSTPTPTPSVATLSYEEATMGAQAVYPEGWQIVEEYRGDSVFIAEEAAAYDDPAIGPWMFVTVMGEYASLSELASETLESFEDPDIEILGPSPATVQGATAEAYVLKGALSEDASGPIQAYLLVTLNQRVGVVFMYGTGQGQWETQGPMLQQLAAGAARIPIVAGPTITSLVFAPSVDSTGEPVDVSDSFPAGTTEVYGVFEYEGFEGVDEYTVVFYRYWDGYETEGVLALTDEGSGQTWFRRENDAGLWPGEYVVEIYVDGDLITLGTFDVEGVPLLEDDFSDENSGFKTWASDTSAMAYQDGALSAHVIKDNWTAYSAYGTVEENSFDDFAIEVDAWLTHVPDEGGEVGLVLRRDGKNYYQLVLRDDSSFKVRLHTDEGWTTLSDWQESIYINSGVDSINRMRAECIGSTMRFYANGFYLTEVTDETLSSGQIGLVAGSYTDGGDVGAVFDDVVVYQFP